MSVQSYRDLLVWQQGMGLAETCYRLSKSFPREEMFRMTSQLRRAAVSVPANIAEGSGRGSRKEYMRFLGIAQGSLKELETHLLLAVRVGLSPEASIQPMLQQAESVGKMLRSLRRKLAERARPSS